VLTAKTRVPAKRIIDRRFALSVATTVRTLLEFNSPETWEVTSEGEGHRIVGAAPAGTHGQMAFNPRGQLAFSTRRPRDLGERDARFQLSGPVAWNIDAGRQQVSANLDVAFVGGTADRIDFNLPSDAERLSITGPDVREVRPRRGGATVFLRGRIGGKTRLAISYERPLPRGARVRFGELSVDSGRWAGGTLVVTNSAGGSEVLSSSLSGLREEALAAIPEAAATMLAGAPALAFNIASPNWSAEVELLRLGEFALTESLADLAQ
jgi:hypothetical protein